MTVLPRFEHLPEGWILYASEDLLVVDKPEGVPTQAADPELPDDLPTRMRRALGSASESIGVHQRLDRETSGVMVFSRTKTASRELARAFEKRTAQKIYLALVEGWRGKEERVLVGYLRPDRDGRMCVFPRGRAEERAVTRVRVLERSGSRTMLELRLETGRTHQARVQLAHAGAAVAGDSLYGGAQAPRMLLHASKLSFPFAGRTLTYASPAPPEFRQWLKTGDFGARVYDDPASLGRGLARALRRRYALLHSDGDRRTTAFRIVNEGGDGLLGLAVDVYGEFLVAHFYEDPSVWNAERKERVLDALAELGFRGVYAKFRPKQANTLVDTRRDELAPRTASRGETAEAEFPIWEEGVPYSVRLGDGLSTGLFLDQRANRRRVRTLAKDKRVLNLFAYTCGFSVAAAAGGASMTVNVDASMSALEWGKRNIERACGKGEHRFVADDVFRWLRRESARATRYDLVILDPPSYSTTKSTRWVAGEDYADLLRQVLPLLAPGGVILACCNHRKTSRVQFRKALHAGLLARGTASQAKGGKVRDVPVPLDFPAEIGRESSLKSAIVSL